MPTYVSLINWTDQGVRDVKATLDRARDAAALAERMGGKLVQTYWTIGPYDIVAVSEFPDDETGEAYLLAVNSQGNIRTTTLRAFTEEEMGRVIAKVG